MAVQIVRVALCRIGGQQARVQAGHDLAADITDVTAVEVRQASAFADTVPGVGERSVFLDVVAEEAVGAVVGFADPVDAVLGGDAAIDVGVAGQVARAFVAARLGAVRSEAAFREALEGLANAVALNTYDLVDSGFTFDELAGQRWFLGAAVPAELLVVVT